MKLALATFAAALGVITATSAKAGILAPTKVSQTVTLVAFNATPQDTQCFSAAMSQLLPDGTSQSFTIPPGKVLVATSVVVSVGPGTNSSQVFVTLWIGDTSPAAHAAQTIASLGPSSALGSATFLFPSGLPSSKGFCVSVNPAVDFDATLNGFLAADK